MKQEENDQRDQQAEKKQNTGSQSSTQQGAHPREGSDINEQNQQTSLGSSGNPDQETAQSRHEREDENREAGMGGGAPQQNTGSEINKDRR